MCVRQHHSTSAQRVAGAGSLPPAPFTHPTCAHQPSCRRHPAAYHPPWRPPYVAPPIIRHPSAAGAPHRAFLDPHRTVLRPHLWCDGSRGPVGEDNEPGVARAWAGRRIQTHPHYILNDPHPMPPHTVLCSPTQPHPTAPDPTPSHPVSPPRAGALASSHAECAPPRVADLLSCWSVCGDALSVARCAGPPGSRLDRLVGAQVPQDPAAGL